MKKTTKEYAEKIAKEWYAPKQWPEDKHREYAQHDFTQGYMKAIEENVVEDLISLVDHVIRYANAKESINSKISIGLKSLRIKAEALKKATS